MLIISGEKRLQDSENFVLQDKTRNKTSWQSFDHPNNCLFPSMRLGHNLTTRHSSTLILGWVLVFWPQELLLQILRPLKMHFSRWFIEGARFIGLVGLGIVKAFSSYLHSMILLLFISTISTWYLMKMARSTNLMLQREVSQVGMVSSAEFFLPNGFCQD